MFLGIASYSQTKKEYPIFSKDSATGQILVIMTIDQAQKLDNSTDLTSLFEKENIEISGYDSACVKVINDQKQVIATQQIQIDDIKSDNNLKEQEVKNLQSQILNYQKDLLYCGEQSIDKDGIISNQKSTIFKQKVKMIIGGGVQGIIIIGLFVLFVTHK